MTGEQFAMVASVVATIIGRIIDAYNGRIKIKQISEEDIPKVEREGFIFKQPLRSPTECGIYKESGFELLDELENQNKRNWKIENG